MFLRYICLKVPKGLSTRDFPKVNYQKVAIGVDDGSRDGERRPGDGGEERDIDTHGRKVHLQHAWSQDFLMVSGFIYLMVSGFRKP